MNEVLQTSQDETQDARTRLLNVRHLYRALQSSDRSYTDMTLRFSRALNQKPYDPPETRVFSPGMGAEGPNAAWIWAHAPGDKFDYYQTRKADMGELCASIWDDERLKAWGALQGEWTIERYKNWAPMRSEQNALDRKRRMAAHANKPELIPCRHGLNTDPMPQPKGLLFYRGRFDRGDHAFSCCPLCFEELQAEERASGQYRHRVVRYGGVREVWPR